MKFSIITTCFNSVSTIKDTVNSVKNGFTSYEHIIVDAGSTDGTLEYLNTLSHIKLFVCPRMGIAEAWNFAIEKCRGDFIGILNADDYYSDNIELALLESIKHVPEVNLIIGDVSIINNHRNELRLFKGRIPNSINLLLGISFLHPSLFVRNSFYSKVGNFNIGLKVAFDADWILRSIKLNPKFGKHNSVVKMRDGGNSIKFRWIGFGEHIQSMWDVGFSRISICIYVLIKTIVISKK